MENINEGKGKKKCLAKIFLFKHPEHNYVLIENTICNLSLVLHSCQVRLGFTFKKICTRCKPTSIAH